MIQPVCQDCKFLAQQYLMQDIQFVCVLFRAELTGEPIQCQGKIPREKPDDNTTNNG